MKYSKIYSGQNIFLSSQLVTIETDIANGLHSFSIVGLGDKAVDEAKDRVSAAIKNIGYVSPKQKNQKVVVSLAPADTRKEGSHFDLGIAIGYLIASGEIEILHTKTLFLGELSLDGALRRVFGVLPIVQKAKELGFEEIIVPHMNAEEAAIIDDISIIPAKNLPDVIQHVTGNKRIIPQPLTKIVYTAQTISTTYYSSTIQKKSKK
jgi:magnesium chelatase family protein